MVELMLIYYLSTTQKNLELHMEELSNHFLSEHSVYFIRIRKCRGKNFLLVISWHLARY